MAIRVETVASGETYPENRQGLLEIVPGVYAPVRVCDLERLVNNTSQQVETGPGGFHVLFHNEYITRTLEELERPIDVLGNASERYRLARGLLHTEHNGLFIPNLRVALLRGCVPDAQLQDILDDNISDEQYRFAADMIEELTHARRDTVYDWLYGNVVRPRDDAVVHALAPLDGFLTRFSQDIQGSSAGGIVGNPQNLQDAYVVYRVVRSGVMSYLSRRPSDGANLGGSGRRRLSLAPELGFIVDYLARDIDEEFSSVLVTRIENVEGEMEQREVPCPKIGWGLVSPSEPPQGVRVLGGDYVEQLMRASIIGKLAQVLFEVWFRSDAGKIDGDSYSFNAVLSQYKSLTGVLLRNCGHISGEDTCKEVFDVLGGDSIDSYLESSWRSLQADGTSNPYASQIPKMLRAVRNLYAVIPQEDRRILSDRLLIESCKLLSKDLVAEVRSYQEACQDAAYYLGGRIKNNRVELRKFRRAGVKELSPEKFKQLKKSFEKEEKVTNLFEGTINKNLAEARKTVRSITLGYEKLVARNKRNPRALEVDRLIGANADKANDIREDTVSALGISDLNRIIASCSLKRQLLMNCDERRWLFEYAVKLGFEPSERWKVFDQYKDMDRFVAKSRLEGGQDLFDALKK